jgi:hypothetical protein
MHYCAIYKARKKERRKKKDIKKKELTLSCTEYFVIMGASASVMSDENFVMMSKDLKEEYDTLIEAGYTDDEIRAQLMEKFNAFTTANQNDSADPESSERIDDNESINAETDGEVDKPLDSNGLVIANNAPFKLGEKEKVGLGNNKDEAPVGSVKGKKTRKRRGMYLYIYTYIYVYIYIYLYIYTYLSFMCTYIHVYIHVQINICIHMLIHVHI